MRKELIGICLCLLLVGPAILAAGTITTKANHAESIKVTKNDVILTNEGEFRATLGVRGTRDAKVFLTGSYTLRNGTTVLAGMAKFSGSELEHRFKGISHNKMFLIQIAMNTQRTTLVGRYTLYTRDDHTFTGVWKGVNGRLQDTSGWITGQFYTRL